MEPLRTALAANIPSPESVVGREYEKHG